jgi:hypothetical protein
MAPRGPGHADRPPGVASRRGCARYRRRGGGIDANPGGTGDVRDARRFWHHLHSRQNGGLTPSSFSRGGWSSGWWQTLQVLLMCCSPSRGVVEGAVLPLLPLGALDTKNTLSVGVAVFGLRGNQIGGRAVEVSRGRPALSSGRPVLQVVPAPGGRLCGMDAPLGSRCAATVLITLVLAGCATTPPRAGTPPSSSGGSVTSASQPAPTPTHPAGFVSEATWTDGPWPLTVSEGTLACQPLGGRLSRVTFTYGGTTYWLNGTAKAAHQYADLVIIWRDNPDIPGTKFDIGPLLDRGSALC